MSHLQYHIETFGCQMNVYDSELVAGLLQKCGYSETEDLNQADIIFMNKQKIIYLKRRNKLYKLID